MNNKIWDRDIRRRLPTRLFRRSSASSFDSTRRPKSRDVKLNQAVLAQKCLIIIIYCNIVINMTSGRLVVNSLALCLLAVGVIAGNGVGDNFSEQVSVSCN